MSLTNFQYLYKDLGVKDTLVLLHGTGGDENDLLPLVDYIDKKYNILSLRGNVSENGMNRFFERFDHGVFNEQSIKEEALKLKEFINSFTKKYNNSFQDLTYVGYSNGANMILAALFLNPEIINNAVLLHPMLPLKPVDLKLNDKNVAVTYGENDQMIPAQKSVEVISTLQGLGANVVYFSHTGGHSIAKDEINFLSKLLN